MFEGWSDYYVLLGTAAAGLIGLLFVVVTLTANFERSRALWASGIYMSPVVASFALVLSTSALTLVPGVTPPAFASLLAIVAMLGLAAAARTCLGIRKLSRSDAPPHWSDLWGYGFGPALTYFALEGVAVAMWRQAGWALYLLAALLLILLLNAIRNAWDLISWMAPGGPVSPPAPPKD
ncbi:MAG TPA: hypothetical protein VFE13_16985 [Caulobacteraceae bacterium]|jgi:hypothetical protein|nr:hypothetical protein [Caulobacteraceae bacterium]